MRNALRGAAAGLLALVGTAAAEPQTLPGIGGNVELPAGWQVVGFDHRMIELGNGDVSVHVGYVAGCDSFFASGRPKQARDADWLPSPWATRGEVGKPIGFACRDGAHPTIVMYDSSADRAAIVALLGALDATWFSSDATLSQGVLVTLPGTQRTVTLPFDYQLIESTPSRDLLHGAAEGDLEVTTFSDGGCDQRLPGATRADDHAPWFGYQVGGGVAYCVLDTTPHMMVVVPSLDASIADDDDELMALLDSLRDETTFVGLGALTTLPGSQWQVALPDGWAVTASDPTAQVDTIGDVMTIRRGAVCSADARYPYDPPWLTGWKAKAAGTITFCREVPAGDIEVEVTAPLPARRVEILQVLGSLASANADTTTTTPAPPDGAVVLGGPTGPVTTREPSHHHLEIDTPIDLAFLSTWTTEKKGLGAHVGLNVVHGAQSKLELSGRGEVGYDSNGKLDYDARARVLYWPIVVLGLIVEGGRAEMGAGEDVPLNHAAFYIGVGFRFGFHLPGSSLTGGLEYTFDKRTVSDTAIGGDPAADDRWIIYGELQQKQHGLAGFSFEYRGNGVASMLLLAARYRL